MLLALPSPSIDRLQKRAVGPGLKKGSVSGDGDAQ